ncbi:hypothetical protein [Paenibacillus rhizoplanae]|uniref:Uncharacterized protein n=2 Tax=Paenibacillus rhizoplanae TaxID=1917181 RepID=A0ABW5FDK9_9BACL
MKEDQIDKSIKLDTNVTIEKRVDGRVVPVENSQNLTDDQLNSILLQMNISEERINDMLRSQKEFLVSQGGTSVDVETSNVKRYFQSSDGTKHLVTDFNKEKIEDLRQTEMKKLNLESDKSINVTPFAMGSDGSGSFNGRGSLTYMGKSPNAAEFTYAYEDKWSFNQNVTQKFTDKIAHAWQAHTTSIGHSGGYSWYVLNAWGNKTLSYSNGGSVSGRIGSFTQPTGIFSESKGYMADIVRIPVTNVNTTGKWVTKYTHPWTAITPSINIGIISLSIGTFVGDIWEWENTFTIKAY